jgi:predicted nucleic acid-binding protein
MELQTISLDASTLILLAKTDILPIVTDNVQVVIPEIVQKEAMAKPESYDAQVIERLIKDGRIKVWLETVSGSIKGLQKQFRLDEGEAASLLLAKEQRWCFGTDDGRAIRAAKILEVPFTTALQILAVLHTEGQIHTESALAKLDILEKLGRYHVQLLEDIRARIKKGG